MISQNWAPKARYNLKQIPMPDARNLATFTQQLAANLTEGDKGKSETLLEQIQTILDEYKRPLPLSRKSP